MKLDQETLQKIAHLARLNFDAPSAEKMSKDLSQVLDWIEQLQEVPTEGVLPLTTMSAEVNVTRLDQVGNQLNQDEALKNAPKQENGFFSVPKVME
ncbi:MAG: Asp-tRNA(Asn)/Glu-tRNA(Gln) amidotransferase subunit GatC [Algoriphagus sp.]|jgi:aspartyl-tRNA(Asn)/glutamyl-tRNA(Gln) amidotransferase subunit C|uniref:Asp-tRNA(Asn)/Glu-tRNA(Gln) amidotransferase subunit GatC n=1 Tax=Algoriphagus sp. TaxID=1872435 RepID=UPI00274523B9|nr:Asp-tRNA(Asn)/Glu-tRNA(Gln) amidotransferase subunit GatC [Algoriphagus sp.]MDP4747903.1 Asp-tRNA(Asn)/Glu-tRNA(Gln) amidotransferase subunit GatC [Algoriphagus sp.]MDP4839331.1 Asp-tRNA(Asn)/Glu-tRNA(Gln) amidotransferase subunit GatC [Algoriphagus sp.]MDP4904383.1 Asp-tRNA(Asn)/Glu-tRNA(Gln) amidotransferase subunit GatC [Algoriphagus sp.]MDP4957034.1 Asp-tRNA(Asn)/Glu-tRNA(Gln) amidotransferase subunit GatC [Algoriphagus sp.]